MNPSQTMRVLEWRYIYLLAYVIMCGYASAGSSGEMENSDELGGLLFYVDGITDVLRNLPFIGSTISEILDWLIKAISLFEAATNGALARLLGGALPCTVSLNGTECTGLKTNGGFLPLLMRVLNDIPFPFYIPDFAKFVIETGTQLFIDPAVDVVFGGVEVN